MKLHYVLFIFISFFFITCKNDKKENLITTDIEKTNTSNPNEIKNNELVKIIPLQHATAIIEYRDQTIYIDPTGGLQAFKNYKEPTIVLITDIHGDHMNTDTLDSLNLSKASIIVPAAVAEKLAAKYTGQLIILNNGETKNSNGISIEAIPMYNLREEALKFHQKGRGNGYIITLGKERIYFSGDTEDIPEMRALENIDKAFICMNLPYTMTVESAASAVLEFKPKQVYPYHYRGTQGLSDVSKFQEIITTASKEIEVIQLDWYPSTE